jgi:hypothetical protein
MFKQIALISLALVLATAADAKDFCHRSDEATLRTHQCYRNVDGDSVHGPAESSRQPPGATAKCRDNAWSFSRHHSGTCSSHGVC